MLPTLFNDVNNIVQHCYARLRARFRLDNLFNSEEQGTLKIRAPTVALNTTTTGASYASDQSKKTKIIKHPYAAKRNYTQNVLWNSTIFTTLKKSNHTWNVDISDAIAYGLTFSFLYLRTLITFFSFCMPKIVSILTNINNYVCMLKSDFYVHKH